MLRDVSAPGRTRSQAISAIVAAAPPLTDDQRARLGVLLTSAPVRRRDTSLAA
ncbi:hypothetical protein [Micromonospora taraxaci]|uniref:hypothetical protein n=1 Tax=Micromonospora taraxaci TaxID=1316803 RepID=UPI003C2E1CCA